MSGLPAYLRAPHAEAWFAVTGARERRYRENGVLDGCRHPLHPRIRTWGGNLSVHLKLGHEDLQGAIELEVFRLRQVLEAR